MSAETSGSKDGEWKVARKIPGWLCASMWDPLAAVLDKWGPPREYGELIEAPKGIAELLASITVGEKRLDNKAVAAAVGWPLLAVLRKAMDGELSAKAEVRHLEEELKLERKH